MKLLSTGLAGALAAAVIGHAGAWAQTSTAIDAYRTVCAQEGDAVTNLWREQISARQRSGSAVRTLTAAEERSRLDVYWTNSQKATEETKVGFDMRFAEEWKDTEISRRPLLVIAACAGTVAAAWNAGVRDVATIKQKWADARYTIYKLPGATAPRPASSSAPAPPATPPANRPTAPVDPTASDPVHCVVLNDTPGSFKNTCDFAVYFTYCGVNPVKGSSVAVCSTQKYGLVDIAARGVQGGFTGAEAIHIFGCRAPATPREVHFVDGKGLLGYCK